MGVDVHPIEFNTNYGTIIFDVWDTAGQEKFRGLGDGYYSQARGAIVMFDTTAKVTLSNAEKWVYGVKNITGRIPISIYGTKCDRPSRECGENYNLISSKININLNTPFLNLARHLTGHDDLVFID